MSDVDVVIEPSQAERASYVDWPAIIAGIVLASAISILLLTFGAALGLSFADFRAGEDVAPIWIAIAAALWLLWVQVSSFMAGGYLTGRLRRRHANATEHEVDVRDGAHGLLVWAGALVLGALIAASGLGTAVTALGSAAGSLTGAAPQQGESAAEAADPNAYYADWLFRPASTAEAEPEDGAAATTETPALSAPRAPGGGTASPTTTAAATAAPATEATAREEARRILAYDSGSPTLPEEDRTYLVALVATNTGLSESEAQARVDEVLADREAQRQSAEEAAETARKTGVLGAFLAAAALLVSAVGAFWAAQKGGQHRDEGTVFADVFRRF